VTELLESQKLKQIVEAALMAADEPLTADQLGRLFAPGELDAEEGRNQIRDALASLEQETEGRGYVLAQVASGYRYQVRPGLAEWVSRLWEEKPPRYSRALLETLALIAYRQPVTRGDIEQVRGVSVSQNIMRTLLERGWIRVVGQREVPGKPSLYGTTRAFLDYFDLKSLDQLPPLTEIRSLIEPLIIQEAGQEGGAQDMQEGRGQTAGGDESPDAWLRPATDDDQSLDDELTEDAHNASHGHDQETQEPAESANHHGAEPDAGSEDDPAPGGAPESGGFDEQRQRKGGEPQESDKSREPSSSAEIVHLPTSPRR